MSVISIYCVNRLLRDDILIVSFLVMEIKNQSIGITGYSLSNPDPVEPGNTTLNLIESTSRNYRL